VDLLLDNILTYILAAEESELRLEDFYARQQLFLINQGVPRSLQSLLGGLQLLLQTLQLLSEKLKVDALGGSLSIDF